MEYLKILHIKNLEELKNKALTDKKNVQEQHKNEIDEQKQMYEQTINELETILSQKEDDI